MNFVGDTQRFKKTIKFFREKFNNKDFSKLKQIKIKLSKKFDGACYYPFNNRKKYHIVCEIDQFMELPEIMEFYVRPKIKNKKKIRTDKELTTNYEEIMVWLLGHELFHFFRDTKQIEGKNTQSQANEFGFKCLREFKRNQSKTKTSTHKMMTNR